jgi:adenylylsulfate kinase
MTPVVERSSRSVWITGLSGAGKSTLSEEVARRLRERGDAVVVLDGDTLREVFGATGQNGNDHGRDARLAMAFKYAHLTRVIAAQGVNVVIATISLFKEIHTWNREHLPGYFEVYLKVPIEELRRRDPKQIYRRYDAGELSDVAGLDLPIDEPQAADWVVEHVPGVSVQSTAIELIARLDKRNAT